jgi:carbamoyltransferase
MSDIFILGISAFYHDSAACILRNGEIIAAAQEERFTRKKHDFDYPTNAIQYCMEEAGINSENLNYVVFYDKPILKFERILETYLTYAPQGIRSFMKAIPLWLKQKLWITNLIKESLDYDGEIYYPEHHESHAAAAFFPSPFESAAILTIDGVGEWTTSSWGNGTNNHLNLKAEIRFPHSLGLLYSAFTYYCGFKVNSGEYKLMGLAPYGEPRFVDLIFRELLDLKSDGSFKLNLKYFEYCAGLKMTHRRFDKLFGHPPRKPEAPLDKHHMDMAASVQKATEIIIEKMAVHLHKETAEENLVLAGGVALNCVANGKILREGPFKNIWIQPAAGDAGGALGAALFLWHQLLENPRDVDDKTDLQKGSYLGPQFSENEIEAALRENGLNFTKIEEETLIERTANLLAEEKVVGWFQGRMEFGPRALGNRSILGDARSPEMQKKMNLKIKFRESFRPFAPSVLLEDVNSYFMLDRESPYMLLVSDVHQQIRRDLQQDGKIQGFQKLQVIRSEIPAITHVDYSARIQTVDGEHNPLYHRLLRKFKEKTGIPVLVNTSFNVRGEPIVCTPQDAVKCFLNTYMDFLVIGPFLVSKEKQPEVAEIEKWQEQFKLD